MDKLYRIKPLEWDEDNQAITAFGVYTIIPHSETATWEFESEGDSERETVLSVDMAKIQAQNHYNDILCSFLEEVPMPTDEDIKKAASDHEKSESMGYSDNISGMYKNIDFESGSRFVIDKLFNNK